VGLKATSHRSSSKEGPRWHIKAVETRLDYK